MVGQTWLRRRLGRVETKRSLIMFRNCVIGAAPAVAAVLGLRAVTDWTGVSGAWLDLVFTTLIVAVVMGTALLILRTPELTEAFRVTVRNRLSRNGGSAGPQEP
jgi:hypothetical protein